MRKIFVLATLFFTSVGASYAQTSPLYQIRVVDATRFTEPARDLKNKENRATSEAENSRHKHHDVVVLRKGRNYSVDYYQSESDGVKLHGFGIMDQDIYKMAEYRWVGDTLNLCLTDGADKKTKVYKGFGKGNTSSLVTD